MPIILLLSTGWLFAMLGIIAVLVIVIGWIVVPLLVARATEPLTRRVQVAVLNATPFGEAIHALRSLGFFAADSHLSDIQLVEKIHRSIEQRRSRHLRSEIFDVVRAARGQRTERDDLPWNWHAVAGSRQGEQVDAVDLLLLSIDTDRIWWRDRRCVYPGADGYVSTLREWAAISRGAFRPDTLMEVWESPFDPVVVRATINGQPQQFQHLNGADPVLDTVGLREWINPLIAATGYGFEICAPQGDPNVVVVLTPNEKHYLQHERGWRFVDHPQPTEPTRPAVLNTEV